MLEVFEAGTLDFLAELLKAAKQIKIALDTLLFLSQRRITHRFSAQHWTLIQRENRNWYNA